jgi:hypothetical protein
MTIDKHSSRQLLFQMPGRRNTNRWNISQSKLTSECQPVIRDYQQMAKVPRDVKSQKPLISLIKCRNRFGHTCMPVGFCASLWNTDLMDDLVGITTSMAKCYYFIGASRLSLFQDQSALAGHFRARCMIYDQPCTFGSTAISFSINIVVCAS